MDWVTTIDTKAACPISPPPDPARLAGRAGLPCPYAGPIMPDGRGLRLAGWEPSEDDDDIDDLSLRGNDDYTAAECSRLRELVAAQAAELEQLRARVAELETENAALHGRCIHYSEWVDRLTAEVAELQRAEDARPYAD